MIKCKDCENFQEIANTNKTRQGLCKYPTAFEPVCADNICVFAPTPLTCADCDRFDNDYACMTAEATDSAEDCIGFIEKEEVVFMAILTKWSFRGYNIDDKINELLTQFKEEFSIPWKAK